MREKFGVGPEKVIDVQALCGDSVDNVPGVPGIGVKTAAELINTYGDLETLLARAEEIKQPKRRQSLIDFAAQARVSRALVELKTDVPVPCPLSDLVLRKPDHDKLMTFLREQGFRSLLNRIQTRQLRSEAVTPITGPAPLPVQPSAETPAQHYELFRTRRAWIAGLLNHARPASLVSIPKRQRSTRWWPSWSVSRSPRRRAAPAISRSAMSPISMASSIWGRARSRCSCRSISCWPS